MYFAFLPLWLKDPAVIVEDQGRSLIKGKEYYKIRITFKQEGGGDEQRQHRVLDTERDEAAEDADAQEMGVVPGDRRNNTVVLQFEVDDVRELFAHLKQTGASITNEPTFNKQDGFWFGAFADPEGNPYWVVDQNCP